MKIKKFTLFSLLLFVSIVAQSQVDGAYGYYQDALLFSRTYQAGTARMMGIGGTQMSLGGDLSSASSNPAGLGFFRRSSLSITPSFNVHNTSSSYLGNSTEDFTTNFNIGHLGAAFYLESNDTNSKFKGGTFSITMTRVNDFYNDTYYDNYNNDNSIIDSYMDRALGIPADQLEGDLFDAYNHYLINPYTAVDAETGEEYTAYDSFVTGLPRQEEYLITSGKQYQWDFAYGGNYNDILFFGLSAGVSTIDYWKESSYYESEFENDGTPDEALNLYNTANTLKLDGVGINSTFGIIVRPVNAFRFGISAKTPTYYSIKETSSESFYTEYNNFEYAPDTLLNDFYDEYSSYSKYELVTPWKFSAGGSIFLGKFAFITADIDYIDYTSMKIKTRDFNTDADNETIKLLYQSTFNYRLGAELRIGPMRFRGGYNYMGDPYINSTLDNSITRLSAGIGFRSKTMFVDFSAIQTKSNSVRQPYAFYDGSGPLGSTENESYNVSMTLGFNF
ncbi:MAG: hypothetical protein JXR07_18470 [Reichenbachiella sp.]